MNSVDMYARVCLKYPCSGSIMVIVSLVSQECPESVPYTLAIYNAKCLSSSSESRDTLMKQVSVNIVNKQTGLVLFFTVYS